MRYARGAENGLDGLLRRGKGVIRSCEFVLQSRRRLDIAPSTQPLQPMTLQRAKVDAAMLIAAAASPHSSFDGVLLHPVDGSFERKWNVLRKGEV